MKKTYLSVALICTLGLSLLTTSCIGSFSLTNKLLTWNQGVGNKFVNELVFFAFWILPVYEVSALADILVLNSIEFWSGSNPVASTGSKIVDGEKGRYFVDCDENGYTITSEEDGSVVRLDYDGDDQSWSATVNGTTTKIFSFIDEDHISIVTGDGSYRDVTLDAQGVMAYQNEVAGINFAAR